MDNRNLILAIVLSIVILFGFQHVYEIFYPKPDVPVTTPAKQAATGGTPRGCDQPASSPDNGLRRALRPRKRAPSRRLQG